MLYIIATPIGNLEDLSFRALRILKEVDLILAEDTRLTKRLLVFYKIKTPLLSYFQHSKIQKKNYILNLLIQEKKIALVTNAGTPGISDPGNELIYFLLSKKNDIIISPIPGPSALISLLSISGFKSNKFLFLGFPPTKKRRNIFFQEVLSSKYSVVFYESPYRIIKTLEELQQKNTELANSELQIAVGKELTKKFETVFRGEIAEVLRQIKQVKIKGEFTVIVNRSDK